MGKDKKVSWEQIAEHTTEEKKVWDLAAARIASPMASPARVH